MYGTMADPRNFDLTLEPNGRPGPNWCFLGVPKAVNNGPVGVARFCTLRSWLSQWSFDDSNGDACTHLKRVSVPVMVLGNSDDDAVPPSHIQQLYEAVSHTNKELHIVEVRDAGEKRRLKVRGLHILRALAAAVCGVIGRQPLLCRSAGQAGRGMPRRHRLAESPRSAHAANTAAGGSGQVVGSQPVSRVELG